MNHVESSGSYDVERQPAGAENALQTRFLPSTG